MILIKVVSWVVLVTLWFFVGLYLWVPTIVVWYPISLAPRFTLLPPQLCG